MGSDLRIARVSCQNPAGRVYPTSAMNSVVTSMTGQCSQCGQPLEIDAGCSASVCPACQARQFAATAAAAAPVTEAAAGAPAPVTIDFDEDSLIADLRDAYDIDPAAPDASASQPLTGGRFAGVISKRYGLPDLPSGSRLGDFEIIAEIGRGGMGVVYRARQISLGREVALKVLPGYARYGQRAVQRFRVEAQAAARLHHTNIVAVHAQGEHDGQYFYAMELVDGVGLDTVIRSRPDLLSSTRARGGSSAHLTGFHSRPGAGGSSEWVAALPPPPAHAPPAPDAEAHWTRDEFRFIATLVADVADALQCAHDNDVVHRDIKPHNIILDANGRLHLTDFGLARLTDEPHLTISGEVMGTPAYLSPEQIRANTDEIDHRTDIYSLGVTLYELCTRRKPFDGESRDSIINQICHGEPAPPRRVNPRVPAELEIICLRAIDRDPRRRHARAAELAEDLRRFAAGRPILSRRATLFERAAKWVKRNRTLSTAIAACVAVAVLGAGWAWQAAEQRAAQAAAHLDAAYSYLAYNNYREPEQCAADLLEAERLGADPRQLMLTQALAAQGATNSARAVELLTTLLHDDPNDQRVLYLLAWAQWRSEAPTASLETLARAAALGPPRAADTWFFRGLAIHYRDPVAARNSYREANALRVREGKFFPHAALNLARARNQELYKLRDPAVFADAEAALLQLIDLGHYEAQPYYLLSIAHRLVAEVYQASEVTRPEIAAGHFERSLYWAREGQRVDPDNDRSIQAEAHCLESMGEFAAARAARTRAIAVATKDRARCEAYHYRWRLSYWLGDYEAALEDVHTHAACLGDDLVYNHVYPALVLAEMGAMDAALEHAWSPALEQPQRPLAVIWSATTLRLLGRAAEADELLETGLAALDWKSDANPAHPPGWMEALYRACLRMDSPGELESLVADTDQPWVLLAQADFHRAAQSLAAGDRETAETLLASAYRSFDGELGYTYHARLLQTKMQQNPAWPAWISVSWNRSHEGLEAAEAVRLARP